jgi:hypothetical protein
MRLPFRLCPTPRIRLRRETSPHPPAARRATEPACHRPSCRRVPVLASAVRQRLARPDAFVPHTASALRTKRAENIVLRAEDGEFCRCPPVFHPICQPSPCRGSPSEWGVRQVFRNSFRIRELVTPIRLSQRLPTRVGRQLAFNDAAITSTSRCGSVAFLAMRPSTPRCRLRWTRRRPDHAAKKPNGRPRRGRRGLATTATTE